MRKKVVIFGACGRGKEVLYSLDEQEYDILGFIDNDEKKIQEGIFCEKSIKAPNLIHEWEYDYVILPAANCYETVEKEAKRVGIPSHKLIRWKETNENLHILDSRIAQLRMCTDLIKMNNIKGCCAELGVYKGDFAKYLNYFLPDRKLYLFDTFEGFGNQELTEDEKSQAEIKDYFTDTNENFVLSQMKVPENCIIRKGLFPATAQGLEETYALVSLDCDLYLPILDGLQYFWPRLQPGGYIFIHDYGDIKWKGVKKAVHKFCCQEKIGIIPFFDIGLSCILAK